MARLSCPYANCPASFNAQHSRTYHVKTVHRVRRGLRPHTQHNHNDQPHRPTPTDNNEGFEGANNFSNAAGPPPPVPAQSQKIYHPHLNGMISSFALVMSLLKFI